MRPLTLTEAMLLAFEMQGRGESAVVVTIAANRSGIALSPGARLVVGDNGLAKGYFDIRLDPLVLRHASRSLEEGRSRSRSYALRDAEWHDVGAQGGEMDVFYEVLARPQRLIVVGAGHIAAPLARVADLMEFRVTVIDDRSEFANVERFPQAHQILVGPYRDTLASVVIDRDTYIVLVTRGHVHDLACLELVVGGDAAYIGMIGSRQRVRTVMEHARAHGHDPERLRRVRAPIGLDIGSQTPVEIAIAIAAEIIAVRRGTSPAALSIGETQGVH